MNRRPPVDLARIDEALRLIWEKPEGRPHSYQVVQAVERVRDIRLAEDRAPKLGEAKEQLDQLRKHAAALRNLLDSENEKGSGIREFLMRPPGLVLKKDSGADDLVGGIDHSSLCRLVTDLDSVIRAADAVELHYRRGPGVARLKRTVAAMPASSRAKLQCAYMTVELWKKARRSAPSKKNGTAMQVAELVWAASGGRPIGRRAADEEEVGAGWGHWLSVARSSAGDSDPWKTQMERLLAGV